MISNRLLIENWYWQLRYFKGIDRLAHSAGCQSYAFFFTRVTFVGWFRTFGKTYSIIQFVLMVALLLHVAVRMLRKVPLRGEFLDWVGDVVKSSGFMLVRKILPWLWSLFCILAIELMIKWNRIDGVNSISTVGQVIPFFVGFGSLVTVITGWDKKDGKADEHEFLQIVVLLFIGALVLGLVGGILAAIVIVVGRISQP